ncbi:hypothetical protein O6H91_04G145900 [Diphasiastrum complanatum]|uniref:Uncharacterized protein n=1 Tax=Diphasiastrum complanatum TaxID=34168 RepID=A0ACC2E2G5_DIPCM|nr:hypothetical protein O6H91_04G145900 [Diphasiastrum complanatum]
MTGLRFSSLIDCGRIVHATACFRIQDMARPARKGRGVRAFPYVMTGLRFSSLIDCGRIVHATACFRIQEGEFWTKLMLTSDASKFHLWTKDMCLTTDAEKKDMCKYSYQIDHVFRGLHST